MHLDNYSCSEQTSTETIKNRHTSIMKKIFSFSRLAAVLLTAMAVLPTQAFAQWDEQRSLSFEGKVGGVIENPLPGANFDLIQNDAPELVGIRSSFSKRYPINEEIKLYSMDAICCLKRGTAQFFASTLDDNGHYILYTIYVDITDNATAVGWRRGSGPDPAASADTMKLAPGGRNKYIMPSFFVCTQAQMINDQMICLWEEISPKSHPYDYESTNSLVAFAYNEGDSLMTNATGETKITMRTLQEEDYINKNNVRVTFPKLKHTFTVQVKLGMEISLWEFPHKEHTFLLDDGFEISSYPRICSQLSVHPQGMVAGVNASPSTYGQELIVRLTDDSPTDVIELTKQEIDGEKYHCFTAKDYGTAKVEIIMPESEESFGSWTDYFYEGRDTLTIHVKPNGYDLVYPEYPLGYSYKPNHYIHELDMTEGDTVVLPHLIEEGPDRWQRFRPHRLKIDTKGFARMAVDGTRVTDSLYAVAAGEDEVVYTYRRSDNCTPTITRLPVHIKPLLPPITTLNLSMKPTKDDDIVLTAYYNDQNQRVEIDEVLTDEAVEEAMKQYTCGTEQWSNALPNTMSFNLAAGKVTVSIIGWTAKGYELRAKVRGKDVQAIHTQTTGAQTHTFTMDLDAPSAIVFYMVEVAATPTPDSAPRRARHSVLEEAISFIQSISIDVQGLPTSIGNEPSNNTQFRKLIENGVLIIEKDGMRYNAQGQKMR